MPPPPPPPSRPSAPPPLHAHKLHLPITSISSPTSLLFDAPTRSLVVLLSDSTALLFPSLPTTTSSSPTQPITIHSAFAACFSRLLPSSHLLFLAASPSPTSSVHLRSWLLPPPPSPARFAAAPLAFSKLDALPFGFGVRLAGASNAVALHSLAAHQIWILAPRLAADGAAVELHKCAVVELEAARPVYAMELSMGRLLLGESGGVRVFPLRPLVKGGRPKKTGGAELGRKLAGGKNGVLNGVVLPLGAGDANRCKLTTVRVKQNSGNYCSFFVELTPSEDRNSSSGMEALKSVKVVSIHPLSKNKFLILNSDGVLHVFSLPNTVMTSETVTKCFYKNVHTYCLDYAMKVQLLAVFPSSSTKKQIFWVSDGGHSVHIISAVDTETPNSDNDGGERNLTTIRLSAMEAIFTSEKVNDIVPLSRDTVLILGQVSVLLMIQYCSPVLEVMSNSGL